MPLASWFLALVTPLVRRALIALGIGVVSYVGLSEILDLLVQQIQTQMGQAPAAIAGIAGLMGVPDAIGIILGGLTARIALEQLKRWQIL